MICETAGTTSINADHSSLFTQAAFMLYNEQTVNAVNDKLKKRNHLDSRFDYAKRRFNMQIKVLPTQKTKTSDNSCIYQNDWYSFTLIVEIEQLFSII